MAKRPGRQEVRSSADESHVLVRFLDFQRDSIIRKVRGLDRELATRSLVGSETTLLGIVKHLVDVEGWWFSDVFAGVPLEYRWSDEDPDGDWRIDDSDTVDGIVDAYQAACERSRQIVAGRGALDVAAHPNHSDRTLRWIMVHMIEETARHAGHADILRELTDGSVGE